MLLFWFCTEPYIIHSHNLPGFLQLTQDQVELATPWDKVLHIFTICTTFHHITFDVLDHMSLDHTAFDVLDYVTWSHNMDLLDHRYLDHTTLGLKMFANLRQKLWSIQQQQQQNSHYKPTIGEILYLSNTGRSKVIYGNTNS